MKLIRKELFDKAPRKAKVMMLMAQRDAWKRIEDAHRKALRARLKVDQPGTPDDMSEEDLRRRAVIIAQDQKKADRLKPKRVAPKTRLEAVLGARSASS